MERTRHRAIDDLTDPVAVELAMIEYDERAKERKKSQMQAASRG
jgi:hypothetical protein